MTPGNVLCHHDRHLMGHFEFLYDSRLFYFKEKLATFLHHESKRNTCFSEKKLVCYEFFFLKERKKNETKWGKHIPDSERLAEELQKHPHLNEEGNKEYRKKERLEGNCLENN